jgi:diguanylate cyclase (GGDEF)-like protein/PAS domain S-box-containing protein
MDGRALLLMIAPLPDDPKSDQPGDRSRQRERLARKWASSVSSTTHVPLQPAEFEQRLADVVDDLVDMLTSGPHLATECGVALVEAGCTDPLAIQSTMDVLGPGLLALPELTGLDRAAERIVQVLGAMAAGYAAALRKVTFAQQETLSMAVRRALTEVQHRLRTVTTQFDHLVSNSTSGIAITDRSGLFLRTNGKLAETLGYTETELAQLNVFDVIPGLLDGHTRQKLAGKDGETTQASLTLLESVGDQWIIVLEDRSELDLLHGQLNHQALHDMVTRLPNRQFFTSRLERGLRQAELAVHHLDLDGFGHVTLGLGRQAGDQLLSTVGQRLEALVAGQKAMVARFSADEFAVLIENPPTPEVTVQRINSELAELKTTACIGVVDRPGRAVSAADVLDTAELALARAKRIGPGQWALSDRYQDILDRQAFRRAVSGSAGREDPQT